MDWTNIFIIVLLGIFGIKAIFYDFPVFMKSETWPQYVKNVLIISLVIGALCGIGYMFDGDVIFHGGND